MKLVSKLEIIIITSTVSYYKISKNVDKIKKLWNELILRDY